LWFAALPPSREGTDWLNIRKHIADETEKWGKVIRAANLKPK
jgi:hypothetical protein